MKVILIKIYGEEEEMVHVSLVSGTPLGLRDMTVISQITDRWRDGPSAHAVHTTFTQTLDTFEHTESFFTTSHQDCGLLNAIYTSLALTV